MKMFWFSGLRARLILLLLIAIIPALMITIYSGFELRKHARFDAFDKAQDFSKEFSKDYQQLIEAARHILFTLSQMPQIQEQNAAESSKIFADILKHAVGYTGFNAINLSGDIFASSHILKKPVNVADRPWFKKVVQTREFVIGEYLIDRISGKPAVVLAYPVFDETENIKMILSAGLDLEQFSSLLAKRASLEGSSLTVIDSEGTILFRYPEPEKYIGKSIPETYIVGTILTRREGSVEAAGLDGEPRLFGFTSIGKGEESLHVALGIPRKIAFEESNRILARNLILLSLIGMLSLLAAWFGGGLLVLQPMNHLLKVTNRLADGDLTVRSELPLSQGEFGRLADSFNRMADSLEQREAERDRAKEDLENQKTLLMSVIDNIPVMIILYGNKGETKLINQEFVRLTGWTAEETRLFDLMEKLYPDPDYRKMTQDYMMSATMDWREFKVAARNGRIIESNWSNVRLSNGSLIGIGIDVTERNRALNEKRLLEEQLFQSQKMEAIGKLAGGIAHDFNNLLTIISGYCQLSLFRLKKGDPLRENIQEIEKASERAANLTRQILAFSRRQPMEMHVLDLNSVLENLDKMLRRTIGEDIKLTALLSDDLGMVMADSGQIEQVIMNLAVNARDAMPDGGTLAIETGNVELDGLYARDHIAVTPGRYVMLSVSDTGVGLTPEVRSRMFDPFFTTKEKGKGTGLGLSMVYGVVKQSGGNIWVYSEPDKGATFKIYLPRVDALPEEAGEKMVRKDIRGGSETILLVEDEQNVRQVIIQSLTQNGYTVLDASCGEDAGELCKRHGGPIHLILTDVVLPGMNGRELVETIASRHPNIKALYMSGYTDNVIVHRGILEKGIRFISKPFRLEALLRKIRETLDEA